MADYSWAAVELRTRAWLDRLVPRGHPPGLRPARRCLRARRTPAPGG